MYLLYSLLLAVALLLTAPAWLLAMLRHGKYRAGLRERLGCVPARLQPPGPAGAGVIWVHAVSVGEVLALAGLIKELRERTGLDRVAISTTTAAGQTLARERFGAAHVFYFPLDFAFAIRPWLRWLKPELVVIAETEFWPNFLRLAHAAGARIAVVNARISDRSLPRYRSVRRLLRPVLRHIDRFLAQSQEDARRLVEVGAPAERVRVSGNLKYDFAPPAEAAFATQLKKRLAAAQASPVLVCGSTVEGEEAPLLEMFEAVLERYPRAVLVLAPRRPERFAQVAQLLSAQAACWWRRSELGSDTDLGGGVLLLDSIGELAAVYGAASVAFVGGSLAPRGGHNILEPACFGVPVVVGPHTGNFRDTIALFRARGAVRVVKSPQELTDTVLELIGDESARAALGSRARETLHAHSGATARTLEALAEMHGQVTK
jgi:3-deoxy-D-manno-octulosonic-acid transferase